MTPVSKSKRVCKDCEMKPCVCNEKLDEKEYFNKILSPSNKILDKLEVKDVDEWSRVNFWKTKKPLYFIQDINGNDGIVVDLKLMQNLARTFDHIINQEIKNG